VRAAVDHAVHAREEPAADVGLLGQQEAERAGVNVTALKTERTTAKAMVSENC
jgi:hypothetical protein